VPAREGRRFRSFRRAVAFLIGVALAGCVAERASVVDSDEVGRCKAGMKQALRANSRGDALQIYQRACSDLFDNAACRSALNEASGVASDDWLRSSLSTCATAYCPMISLDIKACKSGAIEDPDGVDQAWVELSHAILQRKRERKAGDVVFAFARFFADLNARMPPRYGTHAASAAAVEWCARAIEHAATLPSFREQRATYYKECAGVYENECRAAFVSAAHTDTAQQEATVLLGCRKTYCPWFSGPGIEACDGEFVPTREAVARAWPELNRAILELDAKPHAARLMRAVSSLDARSKDGGRVPDE
jgi:hypothetical protein